MTEVTEKDTVKVNGQGLGTIAKGGVLIIIGSFISILANFVYQFFLARLLGPSDLGILNLGISVITLVSLVMIFGLDRALVRYVTYYLGLEDRQREVGVTVSALIILGITVLVITPLFWIATPFLADRVFQKPELLSVLRILSLGLPFIALTRVLLGVAQAYKQMMPILGIEQIAVPVARVAGLLLLVLLLGASSLVAAQSYTFAAILGSLLAIYFASHIYCQRQSGTQPQLVAWEVLHFAWLAMLTIIFNRANAQTETLVLGAFSTSEQVGIYTVGLKATIFISIFLDALATVFTPHIADLYARKDPTRLAQQLKAVTRWAFTLALPVAIILFIESTDIMVMLGPGFESGAPVLHLLVVAQIAYVILGPGGLMLMMTNYNWLNLVNAILNLILSLGLDLALIPRYGAIGAAVAGAVTIVFVNLLRLVQIRYVLHMHPYGWNFLKPALAGLIATAAALLAGLVLVSLGSFWRFFCVSCIVVLVYSGAVLALRLEDTDRELFRLFLSRLTASRLTIF
jgi:O-antigen/teichoic acid export membrane protein